MTLADFNKDKLKVNILSKSQYNDLVEDEEAEFNYDELYVIGEYRNDVASFIDPNNVISSKSYADVGREAVVTQTEEPDSPHTQIWIDPDEEVVYITPANADMDNISEEGSDNVVASLTPDFSKATSYSQAAGNTFTLLETGWLYAIVNASSTIELKQTNVSGADLISITTPASTKMSDHILVEAGTTIYVNARSGTVSLIYYPCKGLTE